MNSNPDILTNVFGYDERDVEFERVIGDIRNVDIDYGIEVIFDYYRRHGFPHYTIREEEKHDHMRKYNRLQVTCLTSTTSERGLFPQAFYFRFPFELRWLAYHQRFSKCTEAIGHELRCELSTSCL